MRGQLAPGEGHFPERLQRKTGWSWPGVAPAPLFFDFPEAAPQAWEAESQPPPPQPGAEASYQSFGKMQGRGTGVGGRPCSRLASDREGRQGACPSGALPHLPLSPTSFLSDPRDASAEMLSWPWQAPSHPGMEACPMGHQRLVRDRPASSSC